MFDMRGGNWWVLVVALASAIALVLLVDRLPENLDVIAIGAALVAGAGVERWRQYRDPRPPSLRATPAAWWATFGRGVGIGYALPALLLAAAAAAILFVSLDAREPATGTAPPAAPADAGRQPRIPVLNRPEGRPFAVRGVAFMVTASPVADWADAILAEPPGTGRRWLTVAVRTKNIARGSFNPAVLDFRLRGSGSVLVGPDRQGAVGPPTLTRGGTLPPGESAQVRLGFRVPRDPTRFALFFEPVPNGQRQVRVRLPLG